MRLIETLLSDTAVENVIVHDYQEAAWKMIFDVDDLAGLFDMTASVDAIPVVDAAVSRLAQLSDEIRQVITSEEKLGVRGYRSRLLAIRRDLVNYPDARISGVIESE